MFKGLPSNSPKESQELIWAIEYNDKTYETEFDLKTKEPALFHKINKNNIKAAGLIGQGYKMYYEAESGQFNICNNKYNFQYKDGDKIIELTNHNSNKEFVTYKYAVSEFNGQDTTPSIEAYYYGYKTIVKVDDLKIDLKIVVCIPINQPAYFDIYIKSNKDLDGQLLIIKNNDIMESINAPLERDVSGGIKWGVK